MIIQVKIRSVDRATAEAGLLDEGVFIPTESGPAPRRGVARSPEIPIWTTQPTYDEEGNMIDPGVRDPRYHMDILAGPPATEIRDENGELVFNKILMLFAAEGTHGVPNKSEVSFSRNGIEVIAIATINSQSHRFAT